MLPVPQELLAKYDRPGPRYTSYPPANRFHGGVGAAEYRAALSALRPGAEVALYVHVPFCERRCAYCGCFTIPTERRSVAKLYVERSIREMELVSESLCARIRANAVHLGGGTPTYLEPGDLERLLAEIRRLFDVSPGA